MERPTAGGCAKRGGVGETGRACSGAAPMIAPSGLEAHLAEDALETSRRRGGNRIEASGKTWRGGSRVQQDPLQYM